MAKYDLKKILLVTSDDDVRTMFKKALSRYDVTLVRAKSYNKAIELAQCNHYDLVLTELFIGSDGIHTQETFDSIELETDMIDNDIRLFTPFKEYLIKLRNIIRNKDEQKLFPLGPRLSNEVSLMMYKHILLLNVHDQFFDEDDLQEFLHAMGIYYGKRGNNVYYSSYEYSDELICHFVEEDIVPITQLEKVYWNKSLCKQRLF